MDDNALKYEYLVRRTHQCGRYGVEGADTDTFRRLQRNAYMYLSKKKHMKLAQKDNQIKVKKGY